MNLFFHILLTTAFFTATLLHGQIDTGFNGNAIVFEDGSGWIETTEHILENPNTNALKATGITIASNGVILDNTIGVLSEFIDRSFIGMIVPFAMRQIPSGWLICDGREIDLADSDNVIYQLLANRIQDTWGGTGAVVDGRWTGTFKIPDLRGYFLRGALTGPNNVSQDSNALIEDPTDTTNFQRYADADLNTTVARNLTVGTYQESAYTAHAGDISSTFTSLTTESSNETHLHSSAQGTRLNDGVGSLYRFFQTPFIFSGYDGHHNAIPFVSYSNANVDGNSSTASNHHTHTFSNSSAHTITLTGANFTNSNPNNAGVIYAIRY